MREVTFAATQMSCSWDISSNLEAAEHLVRLAAAQGAQVILLQELFETPYFCQEQKSKHYALASPFEGNALLARYSSLAKELGVVLPISFFERAGQAYFNSLAMIDADGTILELYRKSHIPDGPGYQEKFYFTPGDTGFKVWDTAFGRFGSAICWDQWFPEAARIMALKGAEALFYPTAIGSEPPPAPPVDSRKHWQRTMQGHGAANMLPVIASNRIGVEVFGESELTFYGSSFIADETGGLVAEGDDGTSQVLTARFDLDGVQERRQSWGLFRDRRPDLYQPLTGFDGTQ